MNKQVVIAPQKGRQELAMGVKCDFIIYGGAAGCLDADTEYLSPAGWRSIGSYSSGVVSAYNPATDSLVFEEPTKYVKLPCEVMTHIKSDGIDQVLSDEHSVVYFEDNMNDLKVDKLYNFKSSLALTNNHKYIKTTFKYAGKGLQVSEGYLRLQVAANILKDSTETLSKARLKFTAVDATTYFKLINLCNKYNINFSAHSLYSGGAYEVIVSTRWQDLTFSSRYYEASAAQFSIICNELDNWCDNAVYKSQYRYELDFVQFACATQGVSVKLSKVKKGTTQHYLRVLNSGSFKAISNPVSMTQYIPEDGYKYCFTVSTGMLVLRRNGKIFITGNSGKSRLALMRSLLHKDDPNYTAVMFRRTIEALLKGGSLFPEAKKLYGHFNPHVNNKNRKITFKSGASVTFDGLQNEGDEEKNYQGSQWSAIFFDEVTHFTEEQVIYMIGRLRSEADNDSYCMATCNPDPDSWVLKYVDWYLDEDGYPVREKGGVIRYFISTEDGNIFGDTREELRTLYPDHCWIEDNEGTKHDVIMTYTFIDGNIFDNPALIKSEPKYLAKLKGQSRVNQARLLHGNWYAREEASGYWKREWVQNKKTPLGCVEVRATDKAATEVSEVNRNPDYTASIKISKDRAGYFYISANFHPDFKDDNQDIHGRFRKRAGARDALILKQAIHDGTDCKVVFAIDPAAAGKVEFFESSKKLIKEGFIVKPDPMPTQKSKLKRFEPFASACENGLVFIDEESFPNKQTLEAYYKELEAFDGERSSASRKDDWPDCSASAFNYLSRQTIVHNIPFRGGTNNIKQAILKR